MQEINILRVMQQLHNCSPLVTGGPNDETLYNSNFMLIYNIFCCGMSVDNSGSIPTVPPAMELTKTIYFLLPEYYSENAKRPDIDYH